MLQKVSWLHVKLVIYVTMFSLNPEIVNVQMDDPLATHCIEKENNNEPWMTTLVIVLASPSLLVALHS